MRASLNGSIRIVGEFPSLTDAEAAGLEADGILVSPRIRLKPDTTDVGAGLYGPPEPARRGFRRAADATGNSVLELLAEGSAEQSHCGEARHQRPDRKIPRRVDFGQAGRSQPDRCGPRAAPCVEG